MVEEVRAPDPSSVRTEPPQRGRASAGEATPDVRARPPADDVARGRVEVRTQFAPDSRRIITDILDPATREVLYRVPPQAVTDAVIRLSEATSRYERLLSGVARPA